MAYRVLTGDIYNQEAMNIPRIIVHGCNAQGKMASGFAKTIRDRWPQAYDAYMLKNRLEGLRPGEIIVVPVSPTLVIVNAITQEFYGYDGAKYVIPEAVGECFKRINEYVLDYRNSRGVELEVHFPAIGCSLGGGTWDEIEPQIVDNLDSSINSVLWIKEGN